MIMVVQSLSLAPFRLIDVTLPVLHRRVFRHVHNIFFGLDQLLSLWVDVCRLYRCLA